MEFYELIEELDAAIFTGDSIFDDDRRNHLKEKAESWLREVKRFEEYFEETEGGLCVK